jgi:hypothetical protein
MRQVSARITGDVRVMAAQVRENPEIHKAAYFSAVNCDRQEEVLTATIEEAKVQAAEWKGDMILLRRISEVVLSPV